MPHAQDHFGIWENRPDRHHLIGADALDTTAAARIQIRLSPS
jgi:hypothetical protein